MPEVLGGGNGFHSFMSHVFGEGAHEVAEAEPAGLETTMMIVSVLIGAAGIGTAWFMYVVKPDLPGKVVKASGPIYSLFYRKYYVDEIYDALCVNPLKWASTHFFWNIVDVHIIDAFVNAMASLVDAMSRVLRRLQSGYYNHYAAGMALGVFVAIGIYIFSR